MQLDISPQEYDLIVEVLQSYMQDLRSEIYSTDTSAYKHELKQRESVLDSFLRKLRNLNLAMSEKPSAS